MTMRAGLIGLGMMGRHHARVLRSLEGVVLTAIIDPRGDPEGLGGGAPIHTRLEDVVKSLDMCVVAAPTAHHEEACELLADAGVATLVEKPLAADLPAARRIEQRFKDRGVLGCVGHIERYNPSLIQLRSRLAAGELGEVHQIATRRQGPFPNRIADVGVVKDLATHDIDLTAWIAGSSFRSVTARVAHKSGREHEDLVAALGVLDDGTVTSHLVNWISPMKERLTVVTGERGCFVADTLTADLTFYANGVVPVAWEAISGFRGVSEGDVIRYAIAKPEPLVSELTAFRDAASGVEDASIVTMTAGAEVVAVADAMLRSAVEGRTVDVASITTEAPAP